MSRSEKFLAPIRKALCGIDVTLKANEQDVYKRQVQQYRAIGTPKKITDLLEKAAEEIENLYGRETQLTEEIRNVLNN